MSKKNEVVDEIPVADTPAGWVIGPEWRPLASLDAVREALDEYWERRYAA